MNNIICWLVSVGDFLEAHDGAITALATLVIAVFTIVLARVSRRQADLTREAMIAGERAFVFATGLNPYWEIDKVTGQYNWRFRPVWQNSGDTPTKKMTIHTECVLRDSTLPKGFDFDSTTAEPGTGLLAPNSKSTGGVAPRNPVAAISPQDIIDIYEGTKFLYLFGWTRYFDVFPKTPQRITRFCWLIVPAGDPFDYVPPKNAGERDTLTFGYIHHTEGNCADDECG